MEVGHLRQLRTVKRRRGHSEHPMAMYEPSLVSGKFLGLMSQLHSSKQIILVAEFCPSIASFGSSTSLIQQGHLWICQLPNTLPISVFYASFNELIFVIFSWEIWLELRQLWNWQNFFKGMSILVLYLENFLTGFPSLLCFSSFPILIFYSERCSASGTRPKFEFWQCNLGQPFIFS